MMNDKELETSLAERMDDHLGTVELHGSRLNIAAAMYLAALSPGRYFDEDGRVLPDGGLEIPAGATNIEAQQHLDNLVSPALTIGWGAPDTTVPRRLAHRVDVRGCKSHPEREVWDAIHLSVYLTGPSPEHDEQIKRWSARCPDVLFVTNRRPGHESDFIIRGIARGNVVSEQTVPNARRSRESGGADDSVDTFLAINAAMRSTVERHNQPGMPGADDRHIFRYTNEHGPGALYQYLESTFSQFDASHSDPANEARMRSLNDALLNSRGKGLGLIDWAICTNLDGFLKQSFFDHDGPPPYITSEGAEAPFSFQNGNRLLPSDHASAVTELLAPRASASRVRVLSELCTHSEEFARLIGSEFGRTANGCHVVAFMARAAEPGTPAADGVREVLRHATFNTGSFDYEKQDGVVRTMGALMASGNRDAWTFLDQKGFLPMLHGYAAPCAIATARDTREYRRSDGPVRMRADVSALTPDLVPLLERRLFEDRRQLEQPAPTVALPPIATRRPGMR
jgi:hypothetical protein